MGRRSQARMRETHGYDSSGTWANLTPRLTSINPTTSPNIGLIWIYVYGTNFSPISKVNLDATDIATNFISPTELSIHISTMSFPPGAYPLYVKNGGLASNALTFTFT